jgi:S-adenosylmethionine-dependent methyltransferase
MAADDPWAPRAERFVDAHYATLRGRVRLYVIGSHLREHLPRPPARLVDVGGGGGNQSVPLARDGYHVTIVDPSAAMLARAEAGLAAEPAEVAARVRLVQASAEDAREALDGARFAGVLCHGVILYVDDPRPFVAALAGLAEHGAELVAWYGVRLFTDSWTPAQLGAGDDDLALEVELQASRRDPYRRLSRLFHLIARRGTGP